MSPMLTCVDGRGDLSPSYWPDYCISYLQFLIGVYAAGAARTLTLFLIIFFALEGILKIYFALRLRPEADWTWGLISGVISVCIGFAVWAPPYGSPLVSVMVGMDLFYSGLATIWIARAMRKKLEKRETLCIGDVCFSG